ncbi:FAD-binding oxidoreductase [Corynebacterium bovis]|uniref:FAD-binding oxidoreductase n=1 Tax=Corynebacterium bovis TaxID=36808 RepID=UPI0031390C9C
MNWSGTDSGWPTAAPADLPAAVAVARDRAEEILRRAVEHYTRTAPPPLDVHQPGPADGPDLPPETAPRPDPQLLLRVARRVLDGLTPAGDFTRPAADLLTALGRDLRKYGVGIPHHEAAAESLIRAVCATFGVPAPGSPTPDGPHGRHGRHGRVDDDSSAGTAELLQAAELAVHLAALGATEDADHGQPATARAEVLEVERRSAEVTVVRLRLTPPLTWYAGQYVEVRTPRAPGVWRHLSPTFPGNPEGLVEFQVRTVPGGTFSPTVPETRPGDRWVIANPAGDLAVSGDRDVLMIAGGTGLGPLRALILDMSRTPGSPAVDVFYGARYPGELVELTGMLGFADAHPWLTVTPVVEHREDAPGVMLSRHRLPEHDPATMQVGTLAEAVTAAGPWPGREVLVCGGPAMVRATVEALVGNGVDPSLIRHDPLI